MMNEIPYENAFIVFKNKTSKAIIVWIFLSITLIIVGICFFFGYHYYPQEEQYAYIEQVENEYRFVTYVKQEEISIFQNYKIKIEEEEIPFQVKYIGQATNIKGEIYCEVILEVEIKEAWKIHNNILTMVVIQPETTWFQRIKKGMKK